MKCNVYSKQHLVVINSDRKIDPLYIKVDIPCKDRGDKHSMHTRGEVCFGPTIAGIWKWQNSLRV